MIRSPTEADIPALAAVHIASWQAAYRDLIPAAILDNLSQSQFEARWRKSLAQASRENLVLEIDGQLMGFVSWGANRGAEQAGVGELYALYLHPDAWGAGYGRELWGQAVSHLKVKYHAATLWVLEANGRARGFYKRMGARPDGAAKMAQLMGAEVPEVRYRVEFIVS